MPKIKPYRCVKNGKIVYVRNSERCHPTRMCFHDRVIKRRKRAKVAKQSRRVNR